MLLDVFGKMSKALETLRQWVSKGGVLTLDTYRLKFWSSQTVSYIATCCAFQLEHRHRSVISPRLSRLFSIFVLPSLTLDVILSLHAPQLKLWLRDVPRIQDVKNTVRSIITATTSLFHDVCDRFQPSLQSPHVIFSHHDLQKVFQGMCLWQPNISTMKIKTQQNVPAVLLEPGGTLLNIVHLWMHECMRTFSDRLSSEEDDKTLQSLIARVATTHYKLGQLDGPLFPQTMDPTYTSKSQCLNPDLLNSAKEPKVAGQRRVKRVNEPAQLLLYFEDVIPKLVYGPGFTDALKSVCQQHIFKASSGYQEQDLDSLFQQLSALVDHEQEDKDIDTENSVTSKYIIHRQRLRQLLHILRVLVTPGGHGVLMASDRGTGRKTTVRLAAYVTGFQVMEICAGNEKMLHEMLKEVGNQTRSRGVHVIILVHENVSSSVRDELLVAMAHRRYPGIYSEEELRNLVSRGTAVKASRRYQMDCWMFEK